MGLKYASVRQPYVVVMAPALTESSEAQGISLKSGALSSPVTLLTLEESADDNLKYATKCKNHLSSLGSSEGMNADSENNKELKTSERDKRSLIKISSTSSEFLNQGTAKESDYSLLQIGGFMMNNCYSGVGDCENTMGQQKPGSQISNIDSCNYLKMDLFKSLSGSVIPSNDLAGGGGDLGHNVDEIMQVIKNMESKGNDIEENLISDGNDITGSLSTFEREFFNDVDMINMCEDENLGDNSLGIMSKDTVIKEKLFDAQERQFKIERKCEWLLRRLRKMQARSMGKHSSEEITGVLQYVGNVLLDSSLKSALSFATQNCTKGDSHKIAESKPMSVTSLIKRLEQFSQQQAVSASQNVVPCKYFGSGRSTCYSLSPRQFETVTILPKLNSDVRKELDNVSGQFHYQLKFVEHGIDSDVTASSSGGESCDEMQCFNNPQQQTLPISERAAWRWAHDRAAIASRWSWLSAQIHDLECRIRQNKEVNKQIRLGKGSVTLAGDEPPRLCDSVVVNGYHGPLPGETGKVIDEELVPNDSCRTRPFLRSSFRKRKLLRTAGLHLTSKRAAKSSTVQCGCHPPLPSCVLCTGRPNPTLPRQDNDLLTVNERIALLDPAFHPVLSLPRDVSQSLHFDALMKCSEWQAKAQRLQMKSSSVMRVMEQLSANDQVVSDSKQPIQQRRRYFRRSLATTLSEKIKKKLAKGKREQNNYALEMFKSRRRIRSHKVAGVCAEDRVLELRQMEEADPSSPFAVVSGVSRPSPVPSPSHGPHSTSKTESFRRKRENSYDIDNIVIPYSVAASTRLEKLQYKEILTPKWRVVPLDPLPKGPAKNNGLIRRLSQDDGDVEDLSDESLISRHERSEQLEKKKFSTYLKLPNSMARARVQRRADSRAGSSGGNTPDPMSPAGDNGGGSPITSPPVTPQPLDLEHYTTVRRRTTSSRCVSPLELDHDEIPPYELRTFPLTDETYEKMLKVMPPGHPFRAHPSTCDTSSRDSECESRPLTPLSDSTESADTCIDEDPNDPEWTVDESSVERVPFKR